MTNNKQQCFTGFNSFLQKILKVFKHLCLAAKILIGPSH